MSAQERWPALRPRWRPLRDGRFYPLQAPAVWWGVASGACAALLLGSLLTGFGLFVLAVLLGASWRRDEIPVLPLCIGYQWLFVMTGPLFQQMGGFYPGINLRVPGELGTAVLLSLLGLVVLVAGVRTAAFFGPGSLQMVSPERDLAGRIYEPRKILRVVVVLYTINWFFEVAPRQIFFGGAQILYNLLDFRTVFLALLLLVTVRRRRGFGNAAVAFGFVLIPVFTSVMASFSILLFIVMASVLGEWRPWSTVPGQGHRNRRTILAIACLAAVVGGAATVWVGAIKAPWRSAVQSGEISGSPLTKLQELSSLLAAEVPRLDVVASIEELVSRTSSGLFFFSLVLDRVPERVPHENGALLWRAVSHVTQPRLLFPNKGDLGSDSWLVRQFAGLEVAGEETGTSIGLGYMAQGYIDFGVPGVLLVAFLYGLIAGFIRVGLAYLAPSRLLYEGSLAVIFLTHFMSYEGEIAKLLGGLIQAFLVFGGLFWALGRPMTRLISGPMRPGAVDGRPAARGAVRRPAWV